MALQINNMTSDGWVGQIDPSHSLPLYLFRPPLLPPTSVNLLRRLGLHLLLPLNLLLRLPLTAPPAAIATAIATAPPATIGTTPGATNRYTEYDICYPDDSDCFERLRKTDITTTVLTVTAP